MATTTPVAERIDSSLHVLLAEVDDLPAVAAEWDSLPDWNRASIALEWAHLMADYLTELEERFRAGAMAPEQQKNYRKLLRALTAALPVIERLNLYRPPAPLEV